MFFSNLSLPLLHPQVPPDPSTQAKEVTSGRALKCSEAAGRSSQGKRKASCPGLCVSPQGSSQKNGNSRVTWADRGHLGTGALWACLWNSLPCPARGPLWGGLCFLSGVPPHLCRAGRVEARTCDRAAPAPPPVQFFKKIV